MAASKKRQLIEGDRVSFRTSLNGDIKRQEGVIKRFLSSVEARKMGVIQSKSAGRVLEIEVTLPDGSTKTIYKYRRKVMKT